MNKKTVIKKFFVYYDEFEDIKKAVNNNKLLYDTASLQHINEALNSLQIKTLILLNALI